MTLFDESLYRFEEAQPSWWEASTEQLKTPALKQDVACDVAVIGGGYTGLSAAYHLAREFDVDVRVLEAGHIGWGSSGRNGGFCCQGGTQLSTKQMLNKFGEAETKKHFACQAEAVELVQQLASENNIQCDIVGDCEMEVAEKPKHFDHLAELAEFQRNRLGMDVSMLNQNQFREQCYDAPHQHGAYMQKPGFAFHPLKFCLGLARAAINNGAKLNGHSKVASWKKHGTVHRLRTQNGQMVHSKHVIVACNGFLPDDLHQQLSARVLPLQSHIVVTRPLTEDELQAHQWKTRNPAINSRNVYFYYRMLPGNRFLIGGRADFRGTPGGAEVTKHGLQNAIAEFWPNWKHIPVEYSWRGFVCFTSRLRPSIGRLPSDPSIYFAYGYHGNGVNNATWSGREIAKWLATGNDKSSVEPMHLPATVRGVSPKFPLPGLRPLYARAGVAWHRFKDLVD